jgi:dTDP-glucose pyrophosphorylase
VAINGRHYAISEFSIRALKKAEVDEIKLIVRPSKLDIPKFYSQYDAPISFYFYKSPSLPESCLYPIDNMHDDDICLFGLPDTLFKPTTAYKKVRMEIESGADICLGLFKVRDGSKFDSVKLDERGYVKGVMVKKSPPLSDWIWGIWGGKVGVLKKLKSKILATNVVEGERLLGVGFDKMSREEGVKIKGVKLGAFYFDIGTMETVVKVGKLTKGFKF